MTDRPILFSTSMVRSLLSGEKTQTRRVISVQPKVGAVEVAVEYEYGNAVATYRAYPGQGSARHAICGCPYGVPGDRLWVRETWALDPDAHPDEVGALYRATDPGWDENDSGLRWKPSIFMPRWASRITLEIAEVRVQRLNSISEFDAVAEGVRNLKDGSGTYAGREGPGNLVTPWLTAVEAYRDLWDSINGKKAPWDSNPWVWAVSFKSVSREG